MLKNDDIIKNNVKTNNKKNKGKKKKKNNKKSENLIIKLTNPDTPKIYKNDDIMHNNNSKINFNNILINECPTDTSSNEYVSEKEINQKNKTNQFIGKAKDFQVKYKTELCKYFECNGYCKYGDRCAYAHGKENLRTKVANTTFYKTKKCDSFFKLGYCPYGNRCQFAHQFKSNILNNPYDKKITYEKLLNTLKSINNINNIKTLVEKPRLQCFKELAKNEKSENSLLNIIKSLIIPKERNIY